MNRPFASLLLQRPTTLLSYPPKALTHPQHTSVLPSLQQRYEYALLLYRDFDKIVNDDLIEDALEGTPNLRATANLKN